MALIFNEKNKSQIINKKTNKEHERGILKGRRNLSQEGLQSQESRFPYTLSTSLSPTRTQMATYYPQYMQPSYSYPLVVTDWNPGIIPLPSPMYTPPIQQIPIALVSPIQIPTLPQCSYTYLTPESLVPNTILPEVPIIEPLYYTPESSPVDLHSEVQSSQTEDNEETQDPLDLFLKLPKDLFPTARMLVLDPNPIIDEFCKIENVNDKSPWILDLEFGIPRVPVTRAIAIYDVKFNSVQCKNTPSAIHPGFESCSEEFKRVFLFYYDCIISTWYRGYMLLNCDKSVENFQSWLLLPMQILGMCWS